jgi:hypothetical protein
LPSAEAVTAKTPPLPASLVLKQLLVASSAALRMSSRCFLTASKPGKAAAEPLLPVEPVVAQAPRNRLAITIDFFMAPS